MANPWDNDPVVSGVDAALAKEGVTGKRADFFKSIYQQESGGGKNTTTSNAGAVGGAQIIPSTFKSVAEQGWDINNPEHNLRAGIRYAMQGMDKSGDNPAKAAAYYYGGPGGLAKAEKGIAVADPRNPKAPNTLQYGQQVASRMGATQPVQGNPWDTDPVVSLDKPTKTRAWSDVPVEALGNIPKSARQFAGGIYDAVTSPIKTASGVFDAAAGAFRNSMPEGVGNFIDKYDPTKTATDRAVKTADAIGSAYKDRYGSSEGFKNTLATDPVGFAGDLSTVLGGGALLSGGKVSSALANASKLTNPLSAIAPVLGIAKPVLGIAKSAVSVPTKTILGLTSGVGAENISQAFNAGLNKTPAFLDNINGRSSMTDVLDLAKQNVSNMGAQKSAAYRAGMVDITKDKAILGFDGIDKALSNGVDSVTFKGQIKNASGADAMQKISQEVANWKSLNPSEFHTPEGLDALKQKIGAITEAIPFEEKTARMVAGNVYNSIKSEISAQAPAYANTMKDYASATDQIKEIERALSLGKNASADTAMRKLQSLSRNNVNTNYGNRLDLARQLEAAGGNDLLPSIAGQAMNSWTPRGISGTLGVGATAGVAGGALNPAILGLLGLQSPKAMGLLSYGAGATLRQAQGILNTFDKYSPKNKSELGLLLEQLGNQPYNK